jgi:hypothetical protein
MCIVFREASDSEQRYQHGVGFKASREHSAYLEELDELAFLAAMLCYVHVTELGYAVHTCILQLVLGSFAYPRNTQQRSVRSLCG